MHAKAAVTMVRKIDNVAMQQTALIPTLSRRERELNPASK